MQPREPTTMGRSDLRVLHCRLRVRIRGAVQGVGFRPFIYGLARRYGLTGFVLNDEDGVLAEVEGTAMGDFLDALFRERPQASRIDGVEIDTLPRTGETGFTIRESIAVGAARHRTVPDSAPCPRCVAECFAPTGRFRHYPFISCAQCGPRFSITERPPFDRATTAMQAFGLCPRCERDYHDPENRRFHAETIACPQCGPSLSHSPEEIALALGEGRIVAVKGVGGYRLLCDAGSESAVAELRRRKRQLAKPFAVLIANAASLAQVGIASPAEERLLTDPARPIVLITARGKRAPGSTSGLAPSIAPGLAQIGVMLPSSPLDLLIFHALGNAPEGLHWLELPQPTALVVTSANLPGEPLIISDRDACMSLAGIAELIVTDNRSIATRVDDSVMAIRDGAPAFIRRARGYAPLPINLGQDGPSVMAVGAHRKTTLCITAGREAFVSQHLGDLESASTLRFFEETAESMLRVLQVEPELVIADLHPDYLSTRYAEETGRPLLRVQHHAAHLAAIAAEHHLRGRLLGVALDGYGYGEDGSAWGGELMLYEERRWQRIGHLRALPLPGGDQAARSPWRMGVAALAELGRGAEAAARFPGIALAGPLAEALGHPGAWPATSSMGRLFDAAAALLGVCLHQRYEGEAAMRLESLVRTVACVPGGYTIDAGILDFRPLLGALLERDVDARRGAELFHGTLVAGLADWIDGAARTLGVTEVALGGGCLANRVLADGLGRLLRQRRVMTHFARAIPANDGGLALGQAALGRAHLWGLGV